jgi:hypothetical protein
VRYGELKNAVAKLMAVAVLAMSASLVPAAPASAQVVASSEAILLDGVVGAGWIFVADVNTGAAIAPAAGALTFTPLAVEGGGALRISRNNSLTGFVQADIAFSNAANKTFRVQPFNNGAPVGAEQVVTLNASGSGSITVPSTGVNFFYLTGLGTTPLMITSMVLKTTTTTPTTPTTTTPTTLANTTTTTPTATTAPAGTQALVLSNGVVGSGWRFITDPATGATISATASGLTFTPFAAEGGGALRVSRDISVTGYTQAEFLFSNAANKTFRVQPFNNGSPIGAEQVATTNASGLAAVTIPATGINFLYVTGLGITSLTISSLVLKIGSATPSVTTAAPTPPTNTISPTSTVAPTSSDAAILANGAVGNGWRFITDPVMAQLVHRQQADLPSRPSPLKEAAGYVSLATFH